MSINNNKYSNLDTLGIEVFEESFGSGASSGTAVPGSIELRIIIKLKVRYSGNTDDTESKAETKANGGNGNSAYTILSSIYSARGVEINHGDKVDGWKQFGVKRALIELHNKDPPFVFNYLYI